MFCSQCGSEMGQDAKFCGRCGGAMEISGSTGVPVTNVKYAGFWIRYAAAFLDGFITMGISVVASIVFFLVVPIFEDESSEGIEVLYSLLSWVVMFAYYIFFTYKKGATLGKMAVGIRVISVEEEKLSLGKVILRETVGKVVSYLTLMIGFMMAGFTEKKQALHDKIAKTYVVYKDPNQKNAAWVILIILIPVLIAVIGILASVVLVSLNSAREKAREAAFKSQVSSIIPRAILACDERNILEKDLVSSGEQEYFDVLAVKNSLKQSCGEDGAGTFSFTVNGIDDYKSFSASCSEQDCDFNSATKLEDSPDVQISSVEGEDLENTLDETSKEINKSLPMMVDEVTQLTSTLALGKGLSYSYKFLGSQKITQADLDASLKEDIINQACTTPETQSLLGRGATFEYRYYDKNSKYIGEIVVAEGDCK